MISTKATLQLIQDLNQTDELVDLEAKTAGEPKIGRSTLETICAFSNEPGLGGGTILLGVSREEALFPVYVVSGVSDPDQLMSDISSACNTTFNAPVRVKMNVEKINGKNVVRLDVRELQPSQKPLYFTATGLPKGAYRRIGPTDIRCNEEDLQLFIHSKEATAYDSDVLADATIDDIDAAAVEAYRRSRADSNALAEELSWNDEEVLYAVGGTRRLDGKQRVTNAGILLFGRTHAQRRLFPTHRVDYIRVPGKTWVADVEKRFDSVDMRGPILTLVGRVIAAIADDLPRAFHLAEGGTGQRQDIPTLPSRVIREAVVNSLMHRNYQTHQPTQIIRYSNRLVIKNPGHSLKSEDRFDDPGSVSRNPHIAAVLHDTGYAENKGSGIRVMKRMLLDRGLTAPTFFSDRASDTFTAVFLFHHFLNEEDWTWLASFASFDLTDDQRRALIYVRETGSIDNAAYRLLIGTDAQTATRNLRKLREHNLLTAVGTSARTTYEPGSIMLAASPQAMEPDFQGSNDSFQDKPPISAHDLPLNLRQALVRHGLMIRAKTEDTQALIASMCRWRPLSATEIASLLKKAPTYISQAHLAPMTRDGRLRFVHPEPNHPDQRYIAD
jgi:ATP-dependent DNA helicase RecG